jgi:osmoprotectant transport system permease protein
MLSALQRFFTRDSVAILGYVLGITSLFLGWLTFKPSRIVSGYSLDLWQSYEATGAFIIIGLWLLCLLSYCVTDKKHRGLLSGLSANLILVATLLLAGFHAGRLLEGETVASRISVGAGIWLTLAGTYIILFASRRNLTGYRPRQHIISWLGIIAFIIILATGWLDDLSVLREFMVYEARFSQEFWRHITLFVVSVSLGALIGIPLGIWATRSRRAEKPIFFITNITQTIPSLALFGLLIAPLSVLSFRFPFLRELGIRGVGFTPAIIALTIYSLLPIIQNTYVGLRQLDTAVLDAGLGMGMNRFQVFRKIEIPLATPLILEGVRIASIQGVGLATVGALIGAGGLGFFVFQGLGQATSDLILLGAIPIIILALVIDAVMRITVKIATPKGIIRVEK